MEPKEFSVSKEELVYFLEWKSSGRSVDWMRNDGIRKPEFISEYTEIVAWPDDNNPSIYILNYPDDSWEIISTDKRTEPVLATGTGKFSMDMENTNLVGWIKDLAAEIDYLHSYSGEIKSGEERYQQWTEIIRSGKDLRNGSQPSHNVIITRSETAKNFGDFTATRSGSIPDTSYHPVPGYYHKIEVMEDFVPSRITNHLTTTQWGENAPYNQYCPINSDIPSLRAPAGSEAVAGGQMVYYLHYYGDMCPEVYNSAYCTAYISNNMDWDAMGQSNKSEANWASFRTADSTRMAAVLMANIGQTMRMEYGASYSSGDLGSLKSALETEYGLESFALPFSGGSANPYGEIYEMLLQGKPSIVHSGTGSDNTRPYTFIVDGFKTGVRPIMMIYRFTPYDMENDVDYIFYTTPYYVHTNVTYFCMNWGKGGVNNEVWVVDSEDWHIASGDHSNREALISFRDDGSCPEGWELN